MLVNYKGKMSNFLVEKLDRHHCNQRTSLTKGIINLLCHLGGSKERETASFL